MQQLLQDPTFEFMMYLTQHDFELFMEDMIKRNDTKKLLLLKHARTLGFDLSDVIYAAIKANDPIIIAMCLKYGANIHYTILGCTYIHICAMENNTSLLKSFAHHGVDLNKTTNDDCTALDIAFAKNHYTCMEILIELGANPYLTINDKSINLIQVLLDIYEPHLKKLFDLTVSHTKSIRWSTDLFNLIKKRILLQNIEPITTLLTRFPNLANKVVENHTLLTTLIELKQTALVHKLIKLKSTNLRPNTIIPYMHKICSTHDIDSILYLLKKDPKSMKKLCHEGRTPIDYILLRYNQFPEKIIINTINLLIEKSKYTKKLLQHRNKLGFRTIESAIQFTSPTLVDFLIHNGCDINTPIIDTTTYIQPITNNDPLAFASKLNKSDIINTLFKHNVTINLFNEMPTAILNAIDSNAENALHTLMLNPIIATTCITTKQKILNYCINNGTNNKNIMTYFTDTENLSLININQDTLLFNKIEKYLFKYINNYYQNKTDILQELISLFVFLKCCSTPSHKSSNLAEQSRINLIKKYFRAISNEHYEQLKDYIFHTHLKGTKMQEIKTCIENIELILSTDDFEMISFAWETIATLQTKHLYTIINTFNNSIRLIRTKLKSNIILLSNETPEYSVHSSNKTDDKYIKTVLSQMLYPIKLAHYDEMYNKIAGSSCTFLETNAYILCHDNKTKITSLIFNDGTNAPTTLFDFYNFNIGKEDKCDPLHMFPFALDKYLAKIDCHEKCTRDIVNKFGKVHLLHFFGMLIYNNTYTIGLYEYFVDATGSLFHRFFRPLDKISDKMKISVLSKFSSDYQSKLELARELMKSF